MPTWFGWTDEAVAMLRAEAANHKSGSEIARLLGEGCTRNAVVGKASRFGIILDSRKAKTFAPANYYFDAPPSSQDESPRTIEEVAKPKKLDPKRRRKTAFQPKPVALFVKPTKAAPHIESPKAQTRLCVSSPVTIAELRDGMCSWPLGDPMLDSFRYCGGPASSSGPYCVGHARLAYQPTGRARASERKLLAPPGGRQTTISRFTGGAL